jgi:NAD(P)-dependent dehydrogenase (short-subunit alcohol dehydrogenase family)
MPGIKDKVVVITGASSGIGEATALLLAERAAKVVLGARGPDRLAALADRMVGSGGEAAYAPSTSPLRFRTSLPLRCARADLTNCSTIRIRSV